MEKQLSDRFKRLSIVLLACMFLTLSACGTGRTVQAKTYYYTLFTQNGQWFMEVRSARVISDIDRNTAKEVVITSVEELRNKITRGDFPASYINDYIHRTPYSNYTVPICNLDQLYDLRLPEGLRYDRITWCGDQYYFSIQDHTASIHCVSKEEYLRNYDYYFHERIQGTVMQDTTDDQGVRDIYTLWRSTNLDHYKVYTIQSQNQTLHVCEHRRYFDYSGKLSLKKAIHRMEAADPLIKLTIFGTDGNYYFYGNMLYMVERPTKEWLSAFALVPYGEE